MLSLLLSLVVLPVSAAFSDVTVRWEAGFFFLDLKGTTISWGKAQTVDEGMRTVEFLDGGFPKIRMLEFYKDGRVSKEWIRCMADPPAHALCVRRAWYRTGQVLLDVPYSNGRRNGTATRYDEDGRVAARTHYRDGKVVPASEAPKASPAARAPSPNAGRPPPPLLPLPSDGRP